MTVSNDRSADGGQTRLRSLFARTALIDRAVARFAAGGIGPVPLPLAVIIAVFLVNGLCNILAKAPPGFDDREQLTDMADWALGYRGVQPPLHTWLIKLVDLVVQNDLAAVYSARAIVLCLLASTLYGIGRALRLSREGAAAAAFGLFLMPPVGWEAQRAYSHSLSGMLFTALFQLAMLMLLRHQTRGSYALAGASAALAVLGKYNGLIALFGAAMAATALPDLRGRFRLRGLGLATAVFLAVLAAPMVWLASRLGTLDDSVGKFRIGAAESLLADRLDGIIAFAGSCLAYAGPLLVVALGVWIVAQADGRARRVASRELRSETRYLLAAIASAFALALVLVLASGATAVKGYWLHPVLITLPAAVAALLEALDRTGWANRFVIFCALPLALASVAAFVFRAFGIGV
ncbi:glycosyltransferase family 39 protein [Jiella mangrovi]|uniref:Glycosyltransferase family 39 protein n=1 Tax=Jiella mangrovi TaxID=2821407 RepID=A0ABS4BLK7_9HYPH|nr:glycosyltransferase family 39 protein [Jiella mangrovi]MBP0617608.1 glycosyltransferase family 39 protein [Jiella mangrovi]